MKIAHVVAYVSADGAYGGPARVALTQAEALAALGHDVTVFAGAPLEEAGFRTASGYEIQTYPARLLLGRRSFAYVAAPLLLSALRRQLAHFDVVHIHLARDLITLPAADLVRGRGVRYVLQTHGMVDASQRRLAKLLDALSTRRVLRNSAAVLSLTEQEDSDLIAVEPTAKIARVRNGVRVAPVPPLAGREDMVLFLARLQSRKRPRAFVEMARLLKDELPDTSFVIAGPDEGEGRAVSEEIVAAGLQDRVSWIGAIAPDRTDEYMERARAYVLPSFGEVFPMSVLEAFRAGTPVVTTRSLGIASACDRYGAAILTDGSPEQLAQGLLSIVGNPEEAEELRRGAARFLQSELDVVDVANALVSIYQGEESA
ncbi:glycosyltransferase [Microbacterium sp. CnD16-F]|uniref:glycosyltransferase n=1 Tax=Microbacterium sp. CnD16-F TaxID=2954493 RepID=UPI0035AB6CAF